MMLPPQVSKDIRDSRALLKDLAAISEFGGRFAGTPGERGVRRWLAERLSRSAAVQEHAFAYQGWRAVEARLERLGKMASQVPCHALVRSPRAEDIEAEVIDLSRGSPDDFERNRAKLRGRIAMVRHEYPFAQSSIHRRIKYECSRDNGCVGFIIANNLPDGGLVTGSSGQGGSDDIPAVGISYDSACLLTEVNRVRLNLKTESFSARGVNLVAELPGVTSQVVVLCAHYDGHDLAESAMDNATGVAAVLRILEAFNPYSEMFQRTLRVILFTNEEWRLYGSQRYVDELSDEARQRIALAISLDTLAGSPRLACLTGGFPELDLLVADAAQAAGRNVDIVPRLLRNSDHFSFADRGIPAMRVVAGFDEPNARTRYILTQGDRCDKIEAHELEDATHFAAELTWQALTGEAGMPHRKAVRNPSERSTTTGKFS